MAGLNKMISVVLADDHPMFREGVRRALTLSGRIEVVAEADTGRQALDAIAEHRPQVAVVDVRMPDLDGIAVVRAVVRDRLPTRVLLLTAFDDSSLVFQAIQEGAAGYILKDASRAQLVEAVAQVAAGGTVIPPELAGGLAGEIRGRLKDEGPLLTDRERQVLKLFAEGLSIPAVANRLFLAPSTVKSHAQRLYTKLGVSDRAAAVAEAMRRGLLE
ncbi:response regulator transcription factor [Streptomyces sp. WAC06614]|uniref:response regulator transcription factor n=1 Tax=Streptomyces sp. WAC06614 TaxID=2487416 RepID=UPI000F799E66|nr:response regulator transcription factor [Streptomyces sp. WAC06614]RSS81233.1 DNA-binding response regulator [Streptomyces sp. WAC06614]